jgi:hypothetical protein
MRIECLTTFLDGRERFEAGDIFTIDDAHGAYFVKNGWAKEAGAPDPAPAADDPVTLDVQPMSHKQKAVTHG